MNMPSGISVPPGPFGKFDNVPPGKLRGVAKNHQFLLNLGIISTKICDFLKTKKHIVQNKGRT